MGLFSRTAIVPVPKDDEFKTVVDPVPAQTPDMFRLEQRALHLYFDYGAPLKNAESIGMGYTQAYMNMWSQRTQKGTPPVALALPPSLTKLPRARVLGNLYFLTTDQIIKLDKARQNLYGYRRGRIPVVLPKEINPYEFLKRAFVKENPRDYAQPGQPTVSIEVDHTAEIVLAHAYVGVKEYWKETIDWETSFFRTTHGHSIRPAPLFLDYSVRNGLPSYFHIHEEQKIEAQYPTVNILYNPKYSKKNNNGISENYDYEPPWDPYSRVQKYHPADDMSALIDGSLVTIKK